MEENAKKILICFYSITMSEQTLKFNEYLVNKREFHASKQAITLNLVDTNEVVISDKFKYSDDGDGSKYCIGCLHCDDVIRPLCIIQPQMSGYIKYFDNDGKNMFLKIEDESVCVQNTLKFGTKLKKLLNTRFHSQPIYDDKYI